MRLSNFRHTVILILILCSCQNQTDYQFRKQSTLTDSTAQERFIVQKQFDRKNISASAQIIEDSALFGTWTDSILLVYEDGSWHGLEPIDKKIQLELYPSAKFQWKEKYTYSKYDSTSMGQFWTSNYNDSSFLTLATNFLGDTIFEQGDTVVTRRFLIDSFQKDTLILRDYNSETETVEKYEAILMTREN